MQENEYSCTGTKNLAIHDRNQTASLLDECRWLAFQQECVLDAQWVTQQIHELIGDSDDPVCRYFDIDSYSGCASLTKEVECTVDEHCNWEASGGLKIHSDALFLCFKIIAERVPSTFWNSQWRFQDKATISNLP